MGDPPEPVPPGLEIRTEGPADHEAVAAVVAAAFESPAEARLVAAIRASEHCVPEWSLVAVLDGEIAGHVMASYVSLRDGDRVRRVPSLSPLAVAPGRQRRGIGSALVRALIARVDAAGEPFMVLEGRPAYYRRFGFEPAAEHGIDITLPPWAPPDAAQVVRLHADDPTVHGHVEYPPAFDAVADR